MRCSMKSKLVAASAVSTPRGGHLLQGVVRLTLEVTLVETPAHLRHKQRPELGIALIDLAAS